MLSGGVLEEKVAPTESFRRGRGADVNVREARRRGQRRGINQPTESKSRVPERTSKPRSP